MEGSLGVVAGGTQVVVVVVDAPLPTEVTYEEEEAALDVVLEEIADKVEELAT